MKRSDFLKALGLGFLAPKIVVPKPEMVTTIGQPIRLSGKATQAMYPSRATSDIDALWKRAHAKLVEGYNFQTPPLA